MGVAEHLEGAAVGAVAGWVRAAEEGDTGLAEGRGEMQGAAIDADDGGGAAGGVDESGEGRDVDVTQAGDVSGLVGRYVEDEGDGEELREGGEVFERPLLGDPTRKGAGEDEGAGREFAFGLAGGEMNGLKVSNLGEVRVLVDDVRGAAGETFLIEPGGGCFAGIGGADDAAGAGQAGDEGGLDEALEVEGEVEVKAAEVAAGFQQGGQRTAVEGKQAGEGRMAGEQRMPAGFGDPVEARGGVAAMQGFDGGQRVQNVAHGAEADHQDVHRAGVAER